MEPGGKRDGQPRLHHRGAPRPPAQAGLALEEGRRRRAADARADPYFVPGPVYVLEEVRAAMLAPVVGHRSPEFMPVYKRITEALKPVFRTTRDVYLATSSATFLMEAALTSLVARDVLHLTNGAFSERWLEIGESLGRASRPDRGALGRDRRPGARPPGAAPQTLRGGDRGAQRDLDRRGRIRSREIARVVREESDALLLVDAVSSLAGAPLETDAWGSRLRLRRRAEGPRGAARAHRLHLLGARRGAGRDDPASRLLRRPAALSRQAPRGRADHDGGGVDRLGARRRSSSASPARGWRRAGRATPRCSARPAVWAAARRLRVRLGGRRALADRQLPAAAGGASTARALVAALKQRGFTLGGGYGRFKESTFRIGHMGEVQTTISRRCWPRSKRRSPHDSNPDCGSAGRVRPRHPARHRRRREGGRRRRARAAAGAGGRSRRAGRAQRHQGDPGAARGGEEAARRRTRRASASTTSTSTRRPSAACWWSTRRTPT